MKRKNRLNSLLNKTTMNYKIILSTVALFLLKFSFAQQSAIITIYPGETLIIDRINETEFNIKLPIEQENLKLVISDGSVNLYRNNLNWILSPFDLRDTLLNDFIYQEGLEIFSFPIASFDSVVEIGLNGLIVKRSNNYIIIDSQRALTKIETEKKPYILKNNYIYQSGKENDFKYVVKDIYTHSIVSEFDADSILFFPTEYINYLVISHKNKKSLIYFKDFTTVQDSIFSYEALDFLTFISSTKDIVYIFNPSFGELRYGLSKATNFKLLKQIWNSENIYEYTRNGISFDYEHGSAIVTTDGQLKYLKKKLNDSVSLFLVDFDSSDNTYQIINVNTAEIIVDNICDFNLISNLNHSLIYRSSDEVYDENGSVSRKMSDYHVFSKDGHDYRKPFFSDPFFLPENYYWNEQPLFNKASLINVFQINKNLIYDRLANSEDKKTNTIFEYVFYNIDSLMNDDRITIVNDIIKKNPRVSELYYYRSKLNYQLDKIKEASMDIDSAILIDNSLDNIVRRIQFDFMNYNKTKKDKKRVIIQLQNAIHSFEIPNVLDYKIYDLYWVTLDLMIQNNYPNKEISNYIIKLDNMIVNNPTIIENMTSDEIKKFYELNVKYKIK
jgi:hypothetical protein